MADAASELLSYRAMTIADLEAVMRIESRAYTFPWTRGIFSDCLRAGHDCRVAMRDGQIVGHAVLSAAVGEAHLLNVCVSRDLQGEGIGRDFVHHLIYRANVLGAQDLFLEVRPSNYVAVALYQSVGFVQVGVRKDYYPATAGREDGWVMALKVGEILQ